MSLLTGASVGKYYGAQDVFKNIDFSVEVADRIGLVGPNGEGKTTLLEILAGVQEATTGQLQSRRGLRVGYLPQDPPVLTGVTLWQGMLEAFAELRRLEVELTAVLIASKGSDRRCDKAQIRSMVPFCKKNKNKGIVECSRNIAARHQPHPSPRVFVYEVVSKLLAFFRDSSNYYVFCMIYCIGSYVICYMILT